MAFTNRPAVGSTVFDSKVVGSTNTWYEFNVTAAITNNGIYTFALTTDDNNLTEFYSRDQGTPDWLSGPDLIVTSAPIYSQTNLIQSIVDLGAGAFQLTFQGTPGAEYYLVASADLAAPMTTWSPVIGSTNTAPAPGGRWSFTVNAGAPHYYRLRAVNPSP
jgi:hypothetical protein